MSEISLSNKRIAKNTLFLYMRMLVMMLTALFTSRIVLDVLGTADYGLNNVIGGVVVLFFVLELCIIVSNTAFFKFPFRAKRL